MIKRVIYKRLGLLCCIVLLGLLWNCKSSDVAKDPDYSRDIKKLEMLKQKETYYIEIEVAYPFTTAATQQVANAIFARTGNNASRIDVSGDGHFIAIKADSVKGDLSFFGERRMNGGHYGKTNGGIVFDGVPKNYEKRVNKQKRKLEIKFNTDGESTENYDVFLEIFPNKNAAVNIRSNSRTDMSYDGTIRDEPQ